MIRTGGMPALNFRNGIKLSNGNIEEIDVNESIDFASLTGVFLSGVGDFVNLFDINVTKKRLITQSFIFSFLFLLLFDMDPITFLELVLLEHMLYYLLHLLLL